MPTRIFHSDNPALFDGITTVTDGGNDAYLVEAALIGEYVRTDPVGSFEIISDVDTAEGETGSCGG